MRYIYWVKFNEVFIVLYELRFEGVVDVMRDFLEDSAKLLDRIVKLVRDGESDGEKEIDKIDLFYRLVFNIRVLMFDIESNFVIVSELGDFDLEL